jgi:AsmA protein
MNRRSIIWSAVIAATAGVLAVPFLLPLGAYRGPLERAASGAIGREVHIRGPINLTVYPAFGVSLADVSIANPPGSHDKDMADVDRVIVGAEIFPLFSGRLIVTELTLDKPVIHLEVKSDGTSNWAFNAGATTPKAQTVQASQFDRIGLAHLNIRQGEITYYDGKSGATQKVTGVSLSLDMPDTATPTLQLPLTLNGQLTYNGEPLKIVNGRLTSVDALLKGRATGARLAISSNIINADFEGTLSPQGNILGSLKLGAHSVRSFAAWVGHPMPPGNGFGLVALEGQFSMQDGIYKFIHSHLAFDSMSLNGDITFDTNPAIPAIRGQFAIDRLDINPYLAPGASNDTVKAAKTKSESPDAPLSLGGLKSVNAELKLVLGGLVMPGLKLEHAIVDSTLKNGVLKADISNIAAYNGGTGKGALTVDASGDVPVFHASLDVTGVNVQPFLTDLAEIKRITGTGSARLDLTSRGSTSAGIVKGLGGKGDIKFSNGNITGVDLVAVSRIVQSVLTTEILTSAVGENAKTPFAQMGGTFTMKEGVLHTDDLRLQSPAVQIDIRGNVDFPTHQLDMHVEPRALKGVPGLKLVDVGVPFFVRGPWDNPSYPPDVTGIAKNAISKLGEDAASSIDLLTKPGLSLKSLLDTGKKKN